MVVKDWRNALLNRAEITQAEFRLLPTEQQLYIVEHRNVFYNINGGVIINLHHKKYSGMARALRNSKNQRKADM